MSLFKPDYERYEGVRPIQFYFLRLLFGLIFLFVGFDTWSAIVHHQGPWNPMRAAALCMFASYSALSILGVFRPLKMIPILLFMIVYKSLWMGIVAYPLWAAGKLAGSPAEGMANVFRLVAVVIVLMPWKYVFTRYFRRETGPSRARAFEA